MSEDMPAKTVPELLDAATTDDEFLIVLKELFSALQKAIDDDV